MSNSEIETLINVERIDGRFWSKISEIRKEFKIIETESDIVFTVSRYFEADSINYEKELEFSLDYISNIIKRGFNEGTIKNIMFYIYVAKIVNYKNRYKVFCFPYFNGNEDELINFLKSNANSNS